MEKIEDMEKMRARVDRFKPKKDGSKKDPVYDMAFAEGENREKIRNILERKVSDCDQTIGGPLID